MNLITLSGDDCLAPDAADELEGMLLGESSFTRLLSPASGPTRVLKPDGSVLLVYLPGVLSLPVIQAAYAALRGAASLTGNRGAAAGAMTEGGGLADVRNSVAVGSTTRLRFRERKLDGSLSNTNRAKEVRSGVVGYMDRNARFPYCRQTAYTLAHADRLAAALPMFRAIDAVFAAHAPERYAVQREVANRTTPEFVLAGTAFTTVTVNLNWQTAVHKDAGDLRAGFGVMSAIRAGSFDGCHLCFPQYRTAVDLHTGGVVLADVHEWHGNTPFHGIPGGFERLSLVLYYREGIRYCGTAEQEAEHAKRRQAGMPVRAVDLSQSGGS